MAPKRNIRLTPLEAIIMDCVWDMSPVTVRQVRERLELTKPMAYNTVLTMMGILRDKGFVRSTREGRADSYVPCVTRKQIGRRSLRELCERFFAGSAHGLVSELLDSRRLSVDEIRAIRREVDRKLRKSGERAGGA